MVVSDCPDSSKKRRGSLRKNKRDQKIAARPGSNTLIVHNGTDRIDHRQQQQPLRFAQEAGDENDFDLMEKEKKPLQYWDNLRNSGIPFDAIDDSAIVRVVNSDGETIRLGHVSNIIPYSESDGTRIPNESLIYIEAGMFLAVKSFNERSSSILPHHLPDLLQGCNLYLTLEILDTILSPIVASRKALSVLNRPARSLQEPFPTSIAGSFRSAVSQPLATLAGVYGVPHVNGQSTSSALDIKDQAPTFVRVVPTNRLDARAYILYLKSVHMHHFSCLFVRDAYGSEFNRDLKVAAAEYGVHVTSVSYQDGDNESIDKAILTLKGKQHRFIFTAITPSAGTLKYILRQAINNDILGNSGHFWMFSEAVTALLEPGFYRETLDVSLESDREIATSLSGTGLVLLEIPKNDRFDDAMQELATDKELYDYYVSLHDSPEMFDGFTFAPVPNFYQSLSFDAIMALGIGICGMPEEFPDGISIVEAIKATTFDGVTGPVKFDNVTGTRAEEGLNFKVVNLIVNVSDDSIDFSVDTSALIHIASGEVDVLSPFIYSQGTLTPPQLPLATVDTNLVPIGVRAVGWALAAAVIVLSVLFALWTYKRRRINLVRASQPVFLVLLCIGTAIMATAIIPLSLQEPVPDRGLDVACMATPWLFTMGFATAVASVLFKMIRLELVFRRAAELHRVQIKAKDFILPYSLYMLANFILLLSWTLVAPLEWTRVEGKKHVDAWGRSLSSYGTCHAFLDDGKTNARIVFASILVALNFSLVLVANYYGYRSRLVPSAFNETYYLTLSMAGVLEAFLIGIPLVFLARDTPTAMFVIASVLITLVCLALLMPTFVSKLLFRRRQQNEVSHHDSSIKRAWARYDANRSSHDSNGSNPRLHRANNADYSVEAIRARVAQRAKEEESSCDISRNSSTDAEEKARRKQLSQQRIKRT